MVWCNHCLKNVSGIRPYDGGLACNFCGRILEDFNFNTETSFVKNAAGQSQMAGNIVRSIQSGISSSRERRLRIAREDFTNLRDALGIGDGRDDVIDMAARFFTMAVEQNFTKGRRSDLVQASCLYLTCREKNIPYLLIDFSSYLRVSVYELGAVYLQLCEMLYIAENRNYEKLVDPSIFIPRFSNNLLKGTNDNDIIRTARDIIASMKRDWIQTGRKPSGICGAALYTAALSHGIKCSKTDIVKVVHICEATLTKRLIEFGDTESGSLNVDELTERERELHKITPKPRPTDGQVVLCMHQNSKLFGYGLCQSCYKEFISVSGGIVGGADPPAYQRAEKERMEKEAGEENEGGSDNLNNDEHLHFEKEPEQENVMKSEKVHSGKNAETNEGTDEHVEGSDESDNFADISDNEMEGYIHNEEEKHYKKILWEEMNKEYLEEQAAKEAAMKAATDAFNASMANCPDAARKLAAAKAAVTKSRKEKQQKRAEEAKNAAPPATAMEAVRRTLEKKRLNGLINFDVLEQLFDSSAAETSPKKAKTEGDMEKNEEKKKKKMKNGEDEAEEYKVGDDEEAVSYTEIENVEEEESYAYEVDEEEGDGGYDDDLLF